MANTPLQAPNMWAFAPDLQAQQVALQRQQQMAEMLRQQAVTPIETGQMVTGAGPARAVPVSGMQALAKILQGGIGGYMQRQNDAKGLELGQQMNGRMNTMSDQTLPPMSGSAPAPMAPPPQDPSSAGLVAALQGGSRALSDGSAVPNRGPTNEAAAAMDNFTANPGQMPQPAPQAMPAPPDMATALRGAVKNARMMGNQDLANKLTEQAWSAYAPTDATKMANAAGSDAHAANKNMLAKSSYIAPLNARPGSIVRDPLNPSKVVAFNPHIPEGGAPQFDQSGNVTGIEPIRGSFELTQAMAKAAAAGKNSVEPMAGVDENGVPVFTNKLAAAGGFPGLPGLPGSGKAPGQMPIPTAGNRASFQIPPTVQAERDKGRLQILQDELANPKNTPQDISDLQHEIGRMQPGGTQAPPGTIRPAAAPGFNESQSALATTAAKRYNDAIALAADSPTRVNVYDNILKLSREGVETGPGQDWKNKFKGYVANTPLLSRVAGGWKDDVSGFQELNKFLYQNAQRNWQAAGGTGTDTQLEAYSHSSPNDTMFPKALQSMAEWGKAGELALQSKTNAMQRWKDSQGGNVVNQDQFEKSWRNSFDPQLFQLKTMAPERAAQMIEGIKTSNPSGYADLMKKAAALKNLGGL
jgi:hypothetical protein